MSTIIRMLPSRDDLVVLAEDMGIALLIGVAGFGLALILISVLILLASA